MKKPKSDRIQHLSDQTKLDIDRIITNPKEEANAQELSIWEIYAYCDPKKQTEYPFFRVLLSPFGDALIEHARQKRKETNPAKLDGEIDDQWGRISQLFGLAREEFLSGHKFNATIAGLIRRELYILFEEWENRNG